MKTFSAVCVIAVLAASSFIPSITSSGVVCDNSEKIPPLWNQRTPMGAALILHFAIRHHGSL